MAKSPLQLIQELTEFLDNSVDSFTKDIPAIERGIFHSVILELRDIDVKRGTVKASVNNLRKISRIKRAIEKGILGKVYKRSVDEFGSAFEKTTEMQTAYFTTIKAGYPTPKFIQVLQTAAIESAKTALTEEGIRANIVDKAGDLLRRNIAERTTFAEMVDNMRNYLTKTEDGVGALSRYSSQIVTDSLNTYAAEYNAFVADDLNLKWNIYRGSLVGRSREFCIALVKKKWVHRSEFGQVARGKFTPRPKDLKGLKPGTDAANLQVNRGGWNCNHLLTPVADEFVPKNIREKFA